MLKNINEVEELVYSSFMEKQGIIKAGEDQFTRNPRFTRDLLNILGAKDIKQKNIMITGSKGKGSLSIILSKILESQGLKVGLFTSPHLINFKERIRINGEAISDEDLVKYGNELEGPYEEVQEYLGKYEYIGPVGACAVMAVSYFHDQKTDVNIFELGRGARYDDVNMVSGIMAGINSIFVEHQGNLGHSLEEVAHHKSGIMKRGMDGVFVGKQEFLSGRNLGYTAFKLDLPIYYLNEDFKCEITKRTKTSIVANVLTPKNNYKEIELPLIGDFQGDNLALALTMAEFYLDQEIDLLKLQPFLNKIRLHGRMELFTNNERSYLLDGCISLKSLDYVLNYLLKIGYVDFNILVAIPEDKDYINILKKCQDIGRSVIFVKVKNHHLRFTDNQIKVIEDLGISYFDSTHDGLKFLEEQKDSKEVLNLLIGTQSLITDVKNYFLVDTLIINK